MITAQDWFVAGGGECGFVVPDPRDWHIIYSNNEGYITRYDKNKEEAQDVSVWPMDNSGHGASRSGAPFSMGLAAFSFTA